MSDQISMSHIKFPQTISRIFARNFALHGLVAAIISFICFSVVSAAIEGGDAGNEEIGEPVIPSAGKGRHVDSAFMAPDGKHLYTLREGLLLKHSINPFKTVSSYEINFKEILSSKNFFKIFVTNDEKQLIIFNQKKRQVILVDIHTGDIVKNIILEEDYNEKNINGKILRSLRNGVIDAVLNGSDLLVFKDLEILVFDADKLTLNVRKSIDWAAVPGHSRVHKVFDKIVYLSGRDVGLIDEKTYKKIRVYNYWDERGSYYCGHSGKTYIAFDLNSIENGDIERFNICGHPVENGASFIEKRKIELGFGPVSTSGHYVISGYRYTLENLENSKKYKIVQYPDGEVILFDTSSEKKLVLTSNAGKHLGMKNSENDIVPMNKATMEKYQILAP